MKEIIKNKYLYFIIAGLLIIIGIIYCIYTYTHISKLEYDLFMNQSKTYMDYYDSLDVDSDLLDRYILYALTYSDNENDKSKLTSSEIKSTLEKVFEKKFSEQEINNVGITPLLMENNITQNYENNEYYIDKESLTQSKIANIKIVVYNLKCFKRKGNKYNAEYEKYLIENPYDVLNYYNDKKVDTSKINSYLRGEGKVKDIKESLDEEYLKTKAKKLDNIKVEYVLKGTKFLIK